MSVNSSEFSCQQTGDRLFDFNEDGLAHIGLMPDFLADMRTVDPNVDLDPILSSAETFIRMWERIENCTPDAALPVPDLPSLPTSSGECSAAVTEVPTATDFCAGELTGTTNDPLEYQEQGTHTITWEFDDGNGNVATQTQTVIVDDVTAPTIDSLAAIPNLLWPPNHKSVPVTITAVASDNCDPNPRCRLTAVTSNEPGGSSDWQLVGDLAVDLRAERLGTGGGRVYTNEVTCSDFAGLSTTGDVQVNVPDDRGKR